MKFRCLMHFKANIVKHKTNVNLTLIFKLKGISFKTKF